MLKECYDEERNCIEKFKKHRDETAQEVKRIREHVEERAKNFSERNANLKNRTEDMQLLEAGDQVMQQVEVVVEHVKFVEETTKTAEAALEDLLQRVFKSEKLFDQFLRDQWLPAQEANKRRVGRTIRQLKRAMEDVKKIYEN
jgi:hypothetical protein